MATTNDVGASRILEKGPEYLRKLLEIESEAKERMSAVERLAATKPKYVKSQQVDYSTKELANNIESVSVSSNGSSNQGSNLCGNLVTVTNSSVTKSCARRGATQGDNVVRRTSSKKRDSLLLYRQKCDLLKGSMNGKNKNDLTRKFLFGSLDKDISLPEVTITECTLEDGKIATPEGNSTLGWSKEASGTKLDSGEKPCDKRVGDIKRTSRNSVSRSHSDISSRYSKNFADFDAFFKYCGLDGEVIESLGKDNFSALSNERSTKIKSIIISSSDDGFSRDSGDSDGLLEEELQEKIRQEISVIERNARVIKWLYSCKNATETGKKLRDLD
ncbi:protein FAM110C [Aplochiton taeniatus]